MYGQMNSMERIAALWGKYCSTFLEGAWVTLLLAVVATAIGCLIGFALGVLQTIPVDKQRDGLFKRGLMGLMRFVITAYVEVFRGTPMIVQASFIYYGIALIRGKPMGMWPAAILIVSINTGAYMAETVRGGIISVDPGQTEGAKAIGMNHVQTMLYVVFPQALRNIIPQIGNNLIINIKDTSVLFTIGVTELFARVKGVAGATYVYFESFAICMVVYFVMTFVCSRLLRWWERKLDGPDVYELVAAHSITHAAGMYTHPSVYKKDKRDQKGAL